MSSKYTCRRPTLPFATSFGTFSVNEKSPLYQCLVVAGFPDINKQAVLAFLFHLGCFDVDKESGEVSFRTDIDSHAISLSSQFSVVLQLVGLHNNHVSISNSKLQEKTRVRQVLCRERKRKHLAPESPRPTPPLLISTLYLLTLQHHSKWNPPRTSLS
jgi:hypothetical protein